METRIKKQRVIVLMIDQKDPLAVEIDVAAARAQQSAPKFILEQMGRLLLGTKPQAKLLESARVA